MRFALEHRQAIVVRPNTARENGVAVVQQMVRSERGTHKAIGGHDVVGRVFGGDVFKDNFEFRKITAQRYELGLNEGGFTVKQIDVAAGDFTVHQQQHACFLHGLKRGVNLFEIGHARIAVGGGTGWIKFASYHTRRFGFDNFFRRQIVGQVQSHEGFKLNTFGDSRHNARLVGQCQFCRGHGWLQVGHDDGARKLGRRVGYDRLECRAIAHMQMPIVGASQGE